MFKYHHLAMQDQRTSLIKDLAEWKKIFQIGQMWRCAHLITGLRKLSQEDYEVEASLGFIKRSCQRIKEMWYNVNLMSSLLQEFVLTFQLFFKIYKQENESYQRKITARKLCSFWMPRSVVISVCESKQILLFLWSSTKVTSKQGTSGFTQ